MLAGPPLELREATSEEVLWAMRTLRLTGENPSQEALRQAIKQCPDLPKAWKTVLKEDGII